MKQEHSRENSPHQPTANEIHFLEGIISASWSKIPPLWPLRNLIAVNPLAGFEDRPFEEALKQGEIHFQQKEIPLGIQDLNRESIKWLQVFFDEGQSTIQMPQRTQGFLKSLLHLIEFDEKIHQNNKEKIKWLKNLPNNPKAIIRDTLQKLKIAHNDQEKLLTLMLTTLPGWAAYIQYRSNWADERDNANPHTVSQDEYLAFRLVLTYCLYPSAKTFIESYESTKKENKPSTIYKKIKANEAQYQEKLIQLITQSKKISINAKAKAQLVFCIDVRSESFRRAIEQQNDYDTYGFAGFFGLPFSIKNAVTGESYASCPVLIKPTQCITEYPSCRDSSHQKGHDRLQGIKRLYQSLKYNFTTPFTLVEAMGIGNGLWMGLKSLFPHTAKKIQSKLKHSIAPEHYLIPDIQSISLEEQIQYASTALKMMGLTEYFAPLVLFCGHGSTTQNNAYATALDCGACAGRHGGANARILASILNSPALRAALHKQDIHIPEKTLFLAAEHNTTTDEVDIFEADLNHNKVSEIKNLKIDLERAKETNNAWRAHSLGLTAKKSTLSKAIALRAQDWAQVRPEWGLARNAAFIIGPRALTKGINLESRSFLHSYEWEKDSDGAILTGILTAPVIVAQWINAQYLFSTLDNVAFGGGSKVTKNITGKIGIMQGNASDLMHGLPFQSVFASDNTPYHEAVRLSVVAYAPKARIDSIIEKHEILQRLFGNGWLHLICFDPDENQPLKLERSLRWTSFT